MKKRLLAGFLSICVMMGAIAYPVESTVVMAEENTNEEDEVEGADEIQETGGEIPVIEGQEITSVGTISGDWTYEELEDGTVEITRYSGSDMEIIIPGEIDGKMVTSIGEAAFLGCSGESIEIPVGVTRIGNSAFLCCYKLTSIDIPASVTYIGEDAFDYCEGLTNINVSEENTTYASQNGIVYNRERTELICCPVGKEGSVSIPSSVTSIRDYAFSDCYKLTSLKIPMGVTDIGKGAFFGCSGLTSIELPSGLTRIENDVFSDCWGLKNIRIPDSVTSIGRYAFFECVGLTDIEIPEGVTDIEEGAFCGCSGLTSIELPSGLTKIENDVFSNCSGLTGFEIPKDVTSIGEAAFYRCSGLTSLEIPEGVTSIGDRVFSDCSSLVSIKIPNSVISIGEYAFYESNNITIHCYKDSASHAYAIENEIPYKLLDDGDEPTHIHQYTSTVTKEATCTEAGVKTHTCSCGDTYTESIPATGHTYTTITVKATPSKNGSITKRCTVCGDIAGKTVIYYPKTITLSKTSYTYNGKARKPSVIVKDSKGKKLKKGTDYTVNYSGGCKNVSKYTVTIKFQGNYSGTVKKIFTIEPKSTSLSKLTAKRKGFTVKWKKLTSQITGYEIQYSTSKKFTKKTTKTATVSKSKTTSKSISKLKAKKKYYVRIRTYKTVKVNGKSTKIYSSWSKAKTITTKK